MKQIYCPACGTLQNTIVSCSTEYTTHEDSERTPYINVTYHCSCCGIFLENERKEDPYLNYMEV